MFPWFSFLTYAVITAVTPGPNNIMSMSHGSRLGVVGAFPFNLGIWAGFSLVMVLCTAFCSLLTTLIPLLQLPMRLAGAGYMLYLAWVTLRSSGEIQQIQGKDGFWAGLLLQFINPKIYLYCIISMETYILPYYGGRPLPLLFFALLLAFIGFVFTLCWSAFGSAFQRLFSRHSRVVNTVMALLLLYCAVSLFLP